MTKTAKLEQEKARETLRELIKPGMTVYTNLRHRAKSGMSRIIDLQVIEDNEPRWIGYTAATAMGLKYDRDRDGIRVSGCGMDMGFHLVYELSHALYPEGFGCIGQNGEHRSWCPSNDHSNGDRDYAPHVESDPHWHRDGGYALKHRWI